jgi:phage portal protein BeeE
MGLAIQQNSQNFFRNGQQPSGILTAPGAITKETAERLKTAWKTNNGGENYGNIAVVGDGLKYEPMAMTANDSQLIEQLKLSGEVVCSAFGVPPYMAQIGSAPNHNSAETMILQYYSQCLQSHIEQMELCLGEGLDLEDGLGIEFSLDSLLRMDTPTKHKTMTDSIKGGLLTPNEGRRRIDMPPLEGGDSIYMQQQNYSLEALAKRDKKENPFSTNSEPADPVEFDGERTFKFFGQEFKIPVVLDKGVYDAESQYEKGDSVTHAGSLWIAQVEKPESKPGEGKCWRLAVKRGKAA